MYGGSNSASDARADEAARQHRIDKGMADIGQTFSGFDDKFYKDRENAYLQYATPELQSQTDRTRKSLTFALSRAGLLGSSSATNRTAALEREVALNQRKVSDQALSSANDLRGEIEGQRGQLVSQLEASADPSATSSLALAQAGRLKAPSPMQPLGNMFADFVDTYNLNQRARSYDPNVPNMASSGAWSFGGGGNGGGSERIVQ